MQLNTPVRNCQNGNPGHCCLVLRVLIGDLTWIALLGTFTWNDTILLKFLVASTNICRFVLVAHIANPHR